MQLFNGNVTDYSLNFLTGWSLRKCKQKKRTFVSKRQLQCQQAFEIILLKIKFTYYFIFQYGLYGLNQIIQHSYCLNHISLF